MSFNITVPTLLELGFIEGLDNTEYVLELDNEYDLEPTFGYQSSHLSVDFELGVVSLETYTEPFNGNKERLESLFFKHISTDVELEALVGLLTGTYGEI